MDIISAKVEAAGEWPVPRRGEDGAVIGRSTSTAAAIGAALLVGSGALAGCGTASSAANGQPQVAASINAWGSILDQLGGSRVHATSVINNPATDPHDYEPTVADARVLSDARLFVENGIGYDSWAAKAIAASPSSSRRVIDVGHLLHVPDGGNPHRWYSPADVERVAHAITTALERIDPADTGYFARQAQRFEDTDLAPYHRLIDDMRRRFAGTPVGASESIFAPLAEALGLHLVTPPGFLTAISEGSEPSARDKAAIDRQIATRQIAVYVYNTQNATPDVSAQVAAAKAAGIPITAITESLAPAGASFQQWQCGQLRALERALHEATGR